jgi:hypothetical protein
MPTTVEYKVFHSLLNKLQIAEMKQDLINDVSNGRTQSAKELTSDEMNALLHHLKGKSEEHNEAILRMRRKIFHFAHLMLWYQFGTTKLDYSRINSFCMKYGHAHKQLNDYTLKELPTLVQQFENMYLKTLKK